MPWFKLEWVMLIGNTNIQLRLFTKSSKVTVTILLFWIPRLEDLHLVDLHLPWFRPKRTSEVGNHEKKRGFHRYYFVASINWKSEIIASWKDRWGQDKFKTHENTETKNEIICNCMQQQSASRKTYHCVVWVFMYVFDIN